MDYAYKQIKDLNNEPDSVEVGQELKIPAIKDGENVVDFPDFKDKIEFNRSEVKWCFESLFKFVE